MKRTIAAVLLILVLIVPIAGCSDGISTDQVLMLIDAWLNDYDLNMLDGTDGDDSGASDGVLLRLTYPAGRSSNVFTTGWVFGASCYYKEKDFSDQVAWSGTGTFSPQVGARSWPSFNETGSNTITLAIKIEDKEYTRSFKVNAVSTAGYASIGMNCQCDAYALGCVACPHTTIGPIITGSSHVLINGKPAARVGDRGIAAGGCGDPYYTITTGDSSVLIDGKPAAKKGLSQVQFAGGVGKIIEGGY